MRVEMSKIVVYRVENDVIYGWFRVKNYDNLTVEYKCDCENEDVSFHCSDNVRKKSHSKWLLNEKELYTTFILNYFNEINKINEIPFFEGRLIKEQFSEKYNKEYTFTIQYDEFPTIATIRLTPNLKYFRLFYQVPIPINSEGKYEGIFIENVLKKETIKQMWEPIRSKTKYRLQLLHVLR